MLVIAAPVTRSPAISKAWAPPSRPPVNVIVEPVKVLLAATSAVTKPVYSCVPDVVTSAPKAVAPVTDKFVVLVNAPSRFKIPTIANSAPPPSTVSPKLTCVAVSVLSPPDITVAPVYVWVVDVVTSPPILEDDETDKVLRSAVAAPFKSNIPVIVNSSSLSPSPWTEAIETVVPCKVLSPLIVTVSPYVCRALVVTLPCSIVEPEASVVKEAKAVTACEIVVAPVELIIKFWAPPAPEIAPAKLITPAPLVLIVAVPAILIPVFASPISIWSLVVLIVPCNVIAVAEVGPAVISKPPPNVFTSPSAFPIIVVPTFAKDVSAVVVIFPLTITLLTAVGITKVSTVILPTKFNIPASVILKVSRLVTSPFKKIWALALVPASIVKFWPSASPAVIAAKVMSLSAVPESTTKVIPSAIVVVPWIVIDSFVAVILVALAARVPDTSKAPRPVALPPNTASPVIVKFWPPPANVLPKVTVEPFKVLAPVPKVTPPV